MGWNFLSLHFSHPLNRDFQLSSAELELSLPTPLNVLGVSISAGLHADRSGQVSRSSPDRSEQPRGPSHHGPAQAGHHASRRADPSTPYPEHSNIESLGSAGRISHVGKVAG
jgi:hypothetical protein